MVGQVKIGFIGCGGIASSHLSRLIKVPKARVVAFTDVDETRVKQVKKQYPTLAECPAFKDYKDMLNNVEMDAVEILTPHTLHFQQAMDALDEGLHALIEKPMVCTVKHAKQLIAKAEAVGNVVLVSYQRHYQSPFRYIRKLISSSGFGETQFISALQCQNWLEITRGTWRQDPALSGGGQLNDSGSHLLDIILWTTGLRAEEVYALIDNLGTPVDVNSTLAVKLSNGAQASISVVGNSPIWWEDITMWGTKGIILYRNGRLQHLPLGGEAFLEPVRFPPAPPDPDANFVNAILGKEANESPPICGLRVIELTEAAWKSAETGKPVKVT